MTFQDRLKRVMRRRGDRVADLARHFDLPYTTVREWVIHGRVPVENEGRIERRLRELEQGVKA
jgi:transposase-like protein